MPVDEAVNVGPNVGIIVLEGETVTVGTESCDVNLLDRLISKAKEEVKIRIIIREPEAFGAASKHFQEAVEKLLQEAPTIEILVCAQMHIKSMIC